MNLLHIEVSPRAASSASRAVSNHLVDQLKSTTPKAVIVSRDLASHPIPHLNGDTIGSFFTHPDARTPDQQKAIALSEQLVDELLASDAVVISTPMWNFGMPSVLKAWVDHVVRAGRTFTFTAEGPKGLAAGKKVYVVVSSGSVFSEGAFAAYDQLSPSLKTALGFIGLTDVEVIRVEGTNDPQKAKLAIEKAIHKIEKLVS